MKRRRWSHWRQYKTNKERVIAYFDSKGYKRCNTNSTKYPIGFKGALIPNTIYFIGGAGAVRAGSGISNSRSVTTAVHDKLRKEGWLP
uniref:Uncharacterized protein n=1 Tax=viral metagenome TaxID=1070528 RepID=A0A6M3L161_9ZZZZ